MRQFSIAKKTGQIAYLNQDDAFHCQKVLRLKIGKLVRCVDNNTDEVYLGRIISFNPVKLLLEETITTNERSFAITLFVGLNKRSDFSLLVHQLAEVGCKDLVPVYFERSQHKMKINYEHSARIIISANNQSNQRAKMNISTAIKFNELLNQRLNYDYWFLVDQGSSHFWSSKKLRAIISSFHNKIAIIIGCAGGFTATERLLISKFAYDFKISNHILRTETAAVISFYHFYSFFKELTDEI